MNRRSPTITVLFALGVGACSFHASCGGKKLDTKKGETAIAKLFEEPSGGLHAKVTCPSDVELKKDVVCECATEIEGVPGRVKVTQTNDVGDVHFDVVEGYVFGAKLEQQIVDRLKQQTGGVEAKVDCGDKVRASKPDSTFQCTAHAPNGDAVTIDVKITDAQGSVDWKIAGQAPAAPPTP